MKLFVSIFTAVLLGLCGFLYYRYYFVFAEGVKSGHLNYITYKGYLFKTYEGKLIQTGLKSSENGGIQSNDFVFSVEDENLARKLQMSADKYFDLHYKEYISPLPWRGNTVYVVDSIISVKENQTIREALPQPTEAAPVFREKEYNEQEEYPQEYAY